MKTVHRERGGRRNEWKDRERGRKTGEERRVHTESKGMENAETSRNSGGTSAAAAHQPRSCGGGARGRGSVAQTRGGMYCERKALRQRGERYGEEDGRGKDGEHAESRSGNLGNRRDVLGFHLERGRGPRRRLRCERTRSVENRRILKRHQQLRQELQRNNNGNNPAILRSPDFVSGPRARVGAKRVAKR